MWISGLKGLRSFALTKQSPVNARIILSFVLIRKAKFSAIGNTNMSELQS